MKIPNTSLYDISKRIKSPISAVVIILVSLTLAGVVVTSIVALAFTSPTVEVKIILSNVISMGSTLLFGGFLLIARDYGSVKEVKYYPVSKKDFGVDDF